MKNRKEAAALLTFAAITMAMAGAGTVFAQGWTQSGENWIYLDDEGYQMTDTWKKSGDNWFYLDESGELLADALVEYGENYYYVNEDGAMICNAWVKVPNEEWMEDAEPESYWYYFQADGKASKSEDGETRIKSINGQRYAFGDDGRMLYGWIDDSAERINDETGWSEATYYGGGEDDGRLATGTWINIPVVDEENEDTSFPEYWFYFGSDSKKYQDELKTIDSKKYMFDERGVAQHGWNEIQEASDSNAGTGFKYYRTEEECWLAQGWFKAVPPEELDEEAHGMEDEYWFYAMSDGELITSQIKTINGKRYAFNEKGEMLHGFYQLKMDDRNILDYEKIETESDLPDTESQWDVYYFGDAGDGAMRTGIQTVELDGERYTYGFKTSGSAVGSGYDGISGGYLYAEGRRLKADKDIKYDAFTWQDKEYLINTSGSLMKARENLADGDGFYYCTDSTGAVTYSGWEKFED